MGWGPAYLPAVTPVTTGPDLTASDRGIAKVWVRRQGSGRTRQALGDEAGAFAKRQRIRARNALSPIVLIHVQPLSVRNQPCGRFEAANVLISVE